MHQSLKEKIRREILRFLSGQDVCDPLHRLSKALQSASMVYLVGGALRNIVIETLHGSAPITGDIDLFVNLSSAELNPKRLFQDGTYDYTDFGGIRWLPENSAYAFDLCRLQDFVIFKKYRLEPSLENLLNAVDFDINSIVFDLNKALLHERNCIAAVRRRVMDFNSALFYNKETTAYRILLLRSKTGFALSRGLFDFIKHEVDLETVIFLKHLYSAKLSGDRAAAIMKDYDRICKCRNYAHYLERAPEAKQIGL